jgi:DNA-binding GntR family transcriptional regulator
MLVTEDITRWTELNLEFHAALWASQDLTRLAQLIKTLRDASAPYVSLSLYFQPSHIGPSNVEHGEMLELYRKRDVERATEQTLAHLDGTLRIIVDAIADSQKDSTPV